MGNYEYAGEVANDRRIVAGLYSLRKSKTPSTNETTESRAEALLLWGRRSMPFSCKITVAQRR